MSEISDISRFRWLIVWLADNLVPEDIRKVQTLLKNQIKDCGDDSVDDALAIFDILVKQNRIHDEDTGLLRTLFISLGRMDLLEAVDDYEREKKAVVRRLKKNSSVLGGPFFGSHDLLNKVISVLDTTYDHIHGVCISGEEGIGKTRFAQEACVRMKGSHKLVTVDLNGLPSMESMYYAIMHAFGVECREYELDNLFGLLRGYESALYANTVLFLDNADSMLNPGSIDQRNPTYVKFIEALKTILEIQNPKLKIMMTSLYDLDMRAGLSSKMMTRILLNQQNGLDMDAAVRMIRYHAGNTVVTYEDAKNVANMCDKNPLVIKIIANRLQDGRSQLTDILPTSTALSSQKQDVTQSSSRLQLASSTQRQQCLQSALESLHEAQRLNIIKLATVPGGFSLETARKIVKYRKKHLAMLQYDLQDLKYLGLLDIKRENASNQFSDKVAIYSMSHTLRAFVIDFVKSKGGANLKAFYKAQNRFIQLFGKKLRNICKLLQTDACNALSHLRQDLGNYLGFLEVLKSAEDFKPSENLWWVVLASELLLSAEEGQTFYRHMAEQAKQRDDMHAYADLKCHEITYRKELGHNPEELLQQLKEVQDILNTKIDSSGDVRSKQFSLATCYCLRGELLTQTKKASEAIQWLQQAVSLRKQLMGDGQHFLIARALNSLGMAMKVKAASTIDTDSEKMMSKKYFLQAYEMCRHLANGSDKHLDIPRYIVNIGDVFRELGQHEDAIECMNRSVELESALGMGGAVAVCRTQEKIATSYCELERYDDAFPVAKQSLEHRKTLSGQVSPDTTHALYVLGSVCLKSRNYREARKYFNEALEIEEELWGRGLSHSDDWQHLKTSIETMMVTLQKQSTLTSYRKRFKDAEDASTKGKLKRQTKQKEEKGFDSGDDSASDQSSLPSEMSDECPVKPRKHVQEDDESSESDASSIASEISDELPVVKTKTTQKPAKSVSDEESLPSEISDEIPIRRREGAKEGDSDDETSSNSSSLPSEISDEFPVRVDRNLNNIDKQNDIPELNYRQGGKSKCPSASGDSAVESISGPSSDETTPPKNKIH
ncbi:uncharacterized protein [Amphiura filiformis]|uniref:uncharacterized protein n=1 Tax=Amphiura filiformis TaxID=82378 RepID=UPI003B221CE3